MAIPLSFPLRATEPHPFAAMTEEEWAAFAPYVAQRLGRPPKDLRATWDAIFRVAVTGCSWQALRGGEVTPGRSHAALGRAARNGLLDRLLLAVSRHPFASEAMAGFEWRVVRAVRRMARQVRPETLYLAAGYGLASALPWPADRLPGVPEHRPGTPPEAWVPRLPPIPLALLRGAPAPLPPPAGKRPAGHPAAARRRPARPGRMARRAGPPVGGPGLGLKCQNAKTPEAGKSPAGPHPAGITFTFFPSTPSATLPAFSASAASPKTSRRQPCRAGTSVSPEASFSSSSLLASRRGAT